MADVKGTVMYVHGYGSSGSALKAQTLRAMFPEVEVLSPTFDYDNTDPWEVQRQLRHIVEDNNVGLIVGSSLGGYHTLCATRFYEGVVWCINPVHDVVAIIDKLAAERRGEVSRVYGGFDNEVFRRLPHRKGQLHFALSTDDELLGDHKPLLELFPDYARVIWKDHSGHVFTRFAELENEIRNTYFQTKQ